MRDPFEVLGLEPGATEDEIRAAWREVSKRVHPDMGGSDEEFREALQAYETLRARSPNGWAEPRERATRPQPYHPSGVWSAERRVVSALTLAVAVVLVALFALGPMLFAAPR